MIVLVSMTLGASLMACENTIEPFDEETGVYSIYGVLTINDEPDLIRVRDLNRPHADDPDYELDATVTLENLTEGTMEVLRDSMIAFDSLYTHNFWTPTPVTPQTTYRLTVEHRNGARSTATATTPHIADALVAPQNEKCVWPIEVRFHDVPSARLIDLRVGAKYAGNMHWWDVDVERSGVNDVMVRFEPDTLLSEVIEDQYNPNRDLYYETRCSALDEEQLHLAFTHYGPDWLNVNLPLNPLESWDVENGLGFFGGLREEGFTIPVDTSAFFDLDCRFIPPDNCA